MLAGILGAIATLSLNSEVGYCEREVLRRRFLARAPQNRLNTRRLSLIFSMILPAEIQLRRSWILSGDFSFSGQEKHLKNHDLGHSVWVQLRNSGLDCRRADGNHFGFFASLNRRLGAFDLD